MPNTYIPDSRFVSRVRATDALAQRWIFGDGLGETISVSGTGIASGAITATVAVAKSKFKTIVTASIATGVHSKVAEKANYAAGRSLASGTKQKLVIESGSGRIENTASGVKQKIVRVGGVGISRAALPTTIQIVRSKVGTGVIINKASGVCYQQTPLNFNPFLPLESYFTDLNFDLIINTFYGYLDMENPSYTQIQNLACTIGDTFGKYAFEVVPKDRNGEIINFDFSQVVIETAILKHDGSVIDNGLIVEKGVSNNILKISISQLASITEGYPHGNYPWHMRLIFPDGLKRTFYKGKVQIAHSGSL